MFSRAQSAAIRDLSAIVSSSSVPNLGLEYPIPMDASHQLQAPSCGKGDLIWSSNTQSARGALLDLPTVESGLAHCHYS